MSVVTFLGATLGISSAIETAIADVAPEILALIPVVLGIAVLPLVLRIGWRLVRGFVK